MEIHIDIHDLKLIHAALRHYINTPIELEYPYTRDRAKDFAIKIGGAVEDYNFQNKFGSEEDNA